MTTAQRTVVVAAATIVAAMLTAPAAWAHVHVEADHAEPGSDAILTFEVPNESDTGALTTQLSVVLPNLTSVSAEQTPGWTDRLDRDTAAGTVRSVTWTAAPGTGIGPDQFALFRVAVQLPKSDTVSFPAIQTYSDGTVVRWDQPPLPNGGEPEHPAPTLTLGGRDSHGATEVTAAPGESKTLADNTARWLAGAGILIAGAAAALALARRRRD
jgi:uncharacterized protein YcnI